MTDAFSIGIAVKDFWMLSPRELGNCFTGYGLMIEREYDRMADMAMFNRTAYHKKDRMKKSDLINTSKMIPTKADTKEIKERLEQNKKEWEEVDKKMANGEMKFKEYGVKK